MPNLVNTKSEIRGYSEAEMVCFKKRTSNILAYASFYGISKFGRIPSGSKWKEYTTYIHQGYIIAQGKIIEDILSIQNELMELRKSNSPLNNKQEKKYLKKRNDFLKWKENIFRKLADTIAWSVFGLKSHMLKRLFLGQPPPILSTSNIDSIKAFLDYYHKENPGCFALCADITSFIQVCDFVCVELTDHGPKFVLLELKEGKVNEAIFELKEQFSQTKNPDLFESFIEAYGKKGAEQLERFSRQQERQSETLKVYKTDEGIDLITGEPVKHIDSNHNPITFFPEIHRMLAECAHNHFAFDIIDGCLYVGVYDAKRGRPIAFDFWMHTENIQDKIYDYREFFGGPIEPPIFVTNIPRDIQMKIAFGEILIRFCLNYEKWFAMAKSYFNVEMKWESRKKSAKEQTSDKLGLIKKNHQLLYCKTGDFESYLGLGILSRMFCEFYRPVETVYILLASSPNRPAHMPRLTLTDDGQILLGTRKDA